MRAAIYDPYLDTGGGGERYVLTVAQILQNHGYQVDIAWKDTKILPWLTVRLGIDLSKIGVTADINRGTGYDFVFWLSDGSIPTLFGKRNVLHFQTPFKGVSGKNLFNKLKFLKIADVVCNSKFTKSVIDNEYGVDSKVIYPPVDVDAFKEGTKENIILYVGRFSQLQQAKRQDILVEAFKKLCDGGIRNFRLVLAGGSNIGGEGVVQSLKEEAKDYPVDILENIPFEKIRELYGKAKIFWSAAGFGVDESSDPQKVEHFGIAIVEAMAAGAVPVVVSKGGAKEIINPGEDGFLWETIGELNQITKKLILNERRREKIAKKSEATSKKFSNSQFEKQIIKLLG